MNQGYEKNIDEPEVWIKSRWTGGMKTLDEPKVWRSRWTGSMKSRWTGIHPSRRWSYWCLLGVRTFASFEMKTLRCLLTFIATLLDFVINSFVITIHCFYLFLESCTSNHIFKKIRTMCLKLQFSWPRWRWVSAATIASDRYVWSC